MADGRTAEPNLRWWQEAGAAWEEEVARRKRYRLPYHLGEVFLGEYFARQAPARVLEFGCGFGRHLRYLRRIDGLDVHGFDQSATLVDRMLAWAEPEWLDAHVVVGEPLAPLPYPDAHFDVVFSMSVLIHNRPENVPGLLRELLRVCRGHLLLVENPLVTETVFFSEEHDGCWQHPLEAHLRALGHAVELLPKFAREHDVYRVRVGATPPVDLHPVTLENLRRMQEELSGDFETPEAVLTGRLAEMTADRDRLWEEAKARLRDAEAAAAAMERQSIEHARVLAARDATLAARDATLAARDAALAERDAALAARDATLAERDAALAERDAALAARDAALAERDATLAAREASLAAMTADRDRLWAEIQTWAAECREVDAERQRVAAHADWLGVELDRVVHSRSFRTAQGIAGSLPVRLARRLVWVAKDRARGTAQIRATGHRHPESEGAEVWVLDGDGSVEGADGHWRRRDLTGGVLAWMADGQGTLVVDPGAGRRVQLRGFRAGGIGEVRFRGRTREIDLYRPGEAVVEVSLRDGAMHVRDMIQESEEEPAVSVATPERERWQEAIERFRTSGQSHMAVVPPDWLGVGTAMRVMFGQVVHVPELTDPAAVESHAQFLLETGAEKIIFGGFARGYEALISRLKRDRPNLRFYVVWCGNAAQHGEDHPRWGFNTVQSLAEQGYINCVGHTKVGLAESLRHHRYPVRTLYLWYPPDPEFSASPIKDGYVHLGLFTAGSGWRKNVHNQITAAALIERHALHAKFTHPHELDWARVVNANVAERLEGRIPEDIFLDKVRCMHCNLYVTFSENGPLFPLESLGVGTLSVIGPAGHLFRDHALLRDRLIVPYPDDPRVIASYVRRAIEERAAILRAYRAFCAEYVPMAKQSVREFLAVE